MGQVDQRTQHQREVKESGVRASARSVWYNGTRAATSRCCLRINALPVIEGVQETPARISHQRPDREDARPHRAAVAARAAPTR